MEDEMKLSLTTGTYQKTPFKEALTKVRSYGYDAVELTAIPTPYPGHIECTKVTAQQVQELRNFLSDIGLQISAITSGPIPPLFTSADKKYVLKAIDLATELSAPVVITFVTRNPAAAATSPKEWRPPLIEALQECATQAQENGIYLALETEPGFEINDPYSGIALIREINHPHMKYNLCVPHILPAIPPEDNLEKVIELAQDLIVNTHLADVKNRRHKHLIPGEGDVDFRALLKRLQEIGYDGYITFDLYPYADRPDHAARKTAEVMKDIL